MTWKKIKKNSIVELKELVNHRHRKVVVAVSGGKDSMTALQLVSECLLEAGLPLQLEALHFAYGLRGQESAEEARFTAEVCQKLDVPLTTVTAGHPPKAGIQEWARNIRWEYYQKHIAEGGIIVTGHHRDDLTETVLQRLARGSHPAGLLGMSSWQQGVWRPLLKLDRPTLEALLEEKCIAYRHDSSNDTLGYSRNRLRHRVIPELSLTHPEASSNIITVAEQVTQLCEFAERSVTLTLEDEKYRPQVQWLNSLPEAVATMVLGLIIRKARSETQAQAEDVYQPGGPIAAFLAGLKKLDAQRPRLTVQTAGGGYLKVVASRDGGEDVRVVYCEAGSEQPFAEIHSRHRNNLALRPLVGLYPVGGKLVAL